MNPSGPLGTCGGVWRGARWASGSGAPLLVGVEIKEKMHTETLARHSDMKSAEDEDAAYENWVLARQATAKKRKIETAVKRCPKCDEQYGVG